MTGIDYEHVRSVRYPYDVPTSARLLWALTSGRHTEAGRRPSVPRIAVLILGDGRDALRQQTIRSFVEHARDYEIAEVIEVDDRRHDLGFCGAIQTGWHALRERERWNRSCGGDGGWEYVFHLEEDWLFNCEFSIADMALLLDGSPDVAQVALRRGPVNEDERRAGGLVEMWPLAYEDGGVVSEQRAVPGLFHSLYWTTNPSLYRMGLLGGWEWPSGPRCEQAFGEALVAAGRSFAFLGTRQDAPWITHNGYRTGTGY